MSITRPKVAIVTTTYFPGSHADVIGTRLIQGYEHQGQVIQPRVEVASLYIEQIGESDMGVELAERHQVPRYESIAEAMTLGSTGVNVDGVVIIGEHGDYELNEFAQKLYPRRRFFEAATSAMLAAGTFVPIFNDKHLGWGWAEASAMYATAQRRGIPLLAGSSVPLAWRIPTGTEWPLGEPIDEIVVAGYGPTEIYGFHNLEALQALAERRRSGETGVVSVQAFAGEAAVQAVNDGTVDSGLLDHALRTFDLDDSQRERATQSAKDVFIIAYADGLRAAVVNCDEVIENWGVAARGPAHEMACQIWLQSHPYGHFIFLVRQIESLILHGEAPYPVERTLLTTGMLDAAMRSRHANGERRLTPELMISYQPVERVPDTAIYEPLPAEPVPTAVS